MSIWNHFFECSSNAILKLPHNLIWGILWVSAKQQSQNKESQIIEFFFQDLQFDKPSSL